jgi:hypothetical protein
MEGVELLHAAALRKSSDSIMQMAQIQLPACDADTRPRRSGLQHPHHAIVSSKAAGDEHSVSLKNLFTCDIRMCPPDLPAPLWGCTAQTTARHVLLTGIALLTGCQRGSKATKGGKCHEKEETPKHQPNLARENVCLRGAVTIQPLSAQS